jgi:hypothetical protein
VVSEFVAPDHAWFEVLPSGLALLVIDLPDEEFGQLPVPLAAGQTAQSAAILADWHVLARVTMTVVDGPGDLGFLVGASTDRLDASAAWIEAAESNGGAIVLFRPRRGSQARDRGVRGGFIGLVDGN